MHACDPLLHGLAACRNRYSDVVLVIMFNVAFPGWLEVHKQLRAAYRPLFRQIVYTGFHRQVASLVYAPQHATASQLLGVQRRLGYFGPCLQ